MTGRGLRAILRGLASSSIVSADVVEAAPCVSGHRLWGALGTHNNEKRRLTLEDAERRSRRSAAVFGN